MPFDASLVTTFLPADPTQCATWADAIQVFPSLDGDTNAERMFNIHAQSVSAFVRSSHAQEYTWILTLSLQLHFMTVQLDAARDTTFDPDAYVGTSGPMNKLDAERVSISYSDGARMTQFESDLSQTEFGQVYLQYVKAVNIVKGLATGNMWIAV